MPLGASSSLLPRLVLLLKIHIHPPTTWLVSPQIYPTFFHAFCSSLTWSALVIMGCKLCPLQSPPFRIKGKPARISPNFRDPHIVWNHLQPFTSTILDSSAPDSKPGLAVSLTTWRIELSTTPAQGPAFLNLPGFCHS